MEEHGKLQVLCDKYVIEKEIGKGSFATVYKGTFVDDIVDGQGLDSTVAIKEVSKSKLKNKKLLENLEIEIAILKKIKHPHIVKLLDSQRTLTNFYLIMEYCSLGDLTFLIKKKNELIRTHPVIKFIFEKFPPPSEKHNGLNRVLIINYLQQLASSLKFLRSKNLVHRDIKPQNLLLSTPIAIRDSSILRDGDNNIMNKEDGFVGLSSLPILKIADFGFARFLPNTALAETLCGSPLYMAPEILNYQKYNAKADLWSVGTVLYEMCCGRPPFKASNHLELYKKIKKANNIINYSPDVEIEDDIKDLIGSLLTFDPLERMEFNDFFNNKLVNEDISMYDLDSQSTHDLKTSNQTINNNLFISEYIEDKTKFNIPKQKNNDNSKLEKNTKSNQQNYYITNTSNKINFLNQKQDELKATNRDINANHERNNNIQNKQLGNSETILEKDYVVVEKKSVEVNAFADELADNNNKYLTKLQNNKTGRSPKNTSNILLNDQILPQTNQRSPRNSIPNTNNSPPQALPGVGNSRRASLVERRISISSLNPSNALSKAIGAASTKLFGATTNKNLQNNTSQVNPTLLNPQIFQDLTENILLRVDQYKDNSNQLTKNSNKLDINPVVHEIESLSAKAFVIYSYAEIKFSQVMPVRLSISSTSTVSDKVDSTPEYNDNNDNMSVNKSFNNYKTDEKNEPAVDFVDPPSNFNDYGLYNTKSKGKNINTLLQSTNLYISNDLPTKALQELATEAIVLYMKSLSILAKAMNITSKWWYESNDKHCSLRLNLLVQWIREKFNDSLEKAGFLRSRLLELNELSNVQNSVNTNSKLDKNINDENFLGEEIYLEKLLYDRALEISKAAAKMELQGEQWNSCELAYATSIWMLQTLLEEESNDNEFSALPNQNLTSKSLTLINPHTSLDDQDREIIRKYIESIANRLKSLRVKINQT